MSRWLPHPLMSLTLVLVWLLLVNELSVAQVLLGSVLAVVIPRFTWQFWPEHPMIRRPLLMARYLLRLSADILIANIQVARLVLGPTRRLRPAFAEFELELEDEFAITVLASTISLTPGTVSADFDRDKGVLLIHSLDVGDTDALCDHIRRRYEEPLKEIFR